MKHRILLIIGILFTLLSTLPPVHAAQGPYVPVIVPKPSNLPGPQHTTETRAVLTETILPRYALGAIGFVGALSVIFLVVGAVRFMVAYGKDESIESAKRQVTYSLVGFILALLAYTIVTIIINLRFEGDENPNPLPPITNEPT